MRWARAVSFGCGSRTYRTHENAVMAQHRATANPVEMIKPNLLALEERMVEKLHRLVGKVQRGWGWWAAVTRGACASH